MVVLGAAKSLHLRRFPPDPVKAGLLYFAVVFAAGFVLGTVRVLLLVPRIGERTAELLETPFMLAVSYLAARWVVRRFVAMVGAGPRLATGFVALALLLAVEFGVVVPLRGLTLEEYFATRDTVSGAAYFLSLVLFALFPLLVRR